MPKSIETASGHPRASDRQAAALGGTAADDGPVGAVLRGAIGILMRVRPSSAKPRGDEWRGAWRHEKVLPEGTVLYKGTSDPDATPGEPSPFTWYTTDVSLARRFSVLGEDCEWEWEGKDPVPMVHEYVLEREIRLPLMSSEAEVGRFCRVYGIAQDYPAKTRADVMGSGLPGWVALKRYPRWGDGDDILIGDVGALAYRRSFDRDGVDIGRMEPEAAQAVRR